jgi:hypothetical protein
MIATESRRLARLRPLYAWSLLGLTIILSAYGVYIHGRTQTLIVQSGDRNKTDYAMYERIVNRVHAGEGYYQATGSEMRDGGYAVRPFPTWRPPTLARLMALFPNPQASRLLIVLMAAVALGCWVQCLRNEGALWISIVGGVLLFCPLAVALAPNLYPNHETWSGLCIVLSLALYARGYRQLSVVSGLLALFFRELALPFVFVMMVVSFWEGRRREALAWFLGVVCFAIFLGVHAWMVNRQLTAADVRVGPGWLYLGGWPFVLKTARSNVLLLASPSWVAGLLLPFMLLGLAGWSSQGGTRVALTVGIYVAAFLFAGRPNQAYWGLMYTSLLPLGLVFAPRAVADLLRAIRSGRASAPAQAE